MKNFDGEIDNIKQYKPITSKQISDKIQYILKKYKCSLSDIELIIVVPTQTVHITLNGKIVRTIDGYSVDIF
jgi:CTP-dependent riboflavin kinase